MMQGVLQCTQFPHVILNLLFNVHTLHEVLELIVIVFVISMASLYGVLSSIPGGLI
jgi:hypothetical protein